MCNSHGSPTAASPSPFPSPYQPAGTLSRRLQAVVMKCNNCKNEDCHSSSDSNKAVDLPEDFLQGHRVDASSLLLLSKYVDQDTSATNTQKTEDEEESDCSEDVCGAGAATAASSSPDASSLVSCLKVRSQEESLSREFGSSTSLGEPVEKATSSSEQEDQPEAAKDRRKVSFAQVTVNSHSIVLGDNPSVSAGPPISISWEPFESESFAVEEYEELKPCPRAQAQLHIPKSLREDWLRAEGYARSELFDVMREIQKVRRRRQLSVKHHFLALGNHNPYDPSAKSALAMKKAVKKVLSAVKNVQHSMKKTGGNKKDGEELQEQFKAEALAV